MRRRIPTIEEAIPRALVGLAPRSRDLYAYYLQLLADRHGHRKIDQLTVSDITELGAWVQAMAVRRRTSVNGTSAREHAIAACRRLFDTAIADGYLLHNPAKAVRKPPRGERRRTALTDDQVAEVFAVVRDEETGLLTFLLETACRREGLLGLTPEKLHPARQTVLLDEKGSRRREQPVSELMMEYLQQPACPIYSWTRRRLDSLWQRVRRDLPWANEIGLSTHWFRHTTITNVERVTRSPVLAAAFAGHRLSKFGATATYIAPYGVPDVAWAFTQVFGGTHPLVTPANTSVEPEPSTEQRT
ncbi:tyrosine-type recombinase/integrase [Actinoplanes subtropicus]|uniref:tyrosine-type recombinase/integrase n=1 Tax=Actinoplanes subtropicus TaxID=543632 RepID=UPI0004C3BA0F|nr:site-specific integrase [Actinoplanes subtropicus]